MSAYIPVARVIVAFAGCMHLQSVAAEPAETNLLEIVVIGTRTQARYVTDSPAPVDVFPGSEFSNQSDSEMVDLIHNIIPSYNMSSTGDAASLVRPASLRGLPSDATLVMVNGKRRHRSAVITFIGGGLSDGAQGPDISVIPAAALDRLEVLRDGAAAQYGSDAIAGVLNFVLKEDNHGRSLETKAGQSYAGDGESIQIAGNAGIPVSTTGFANVTVEYSETSPTVRSVQRGDAAALVAEGNTAVENPAQRSGTAEIFSNFKSFINTGVDLGSDKEWYAFGNYAKRRVETGFSYRNPNTRSSVFASALNLPGAEPDANGNAIPYLVDANYNTVPRNQIVDSNNLLRADLPEQPWSRRYDRLVGDITTTGSDGNCPQTGADGEGGLDINDAAGLILVQANPNCFVFNEWFPGGFTPRFGTDLKDLSAVTGVRGNIGHDLTWDISVGTGRNEAAFYLRNTVNASMGPDSPTDFYVGTYVQHEDNINADISYALDGDIPQNIAGGVEWHKERFQSVGGESASWQPGSLVDQGFSIGANGFSGFSPEMVGEWSRTNVSLYGDYEAQVTNDLLLGTALRWEDFDTFGSTTNYKLSVLWSLNDNIALRSTHSIDFRAPTPGQANISNITTVLSEGELINRGTIPPTHEIAKRYGGKELTPEKAKNFTLGTIMRFGDLEFTVDAYQITMNDRITQSANIDLTAQQAQELENAGLTGASDLRSFRFYINDFATQTRGIDIVTTYSFDFLKGSNELSLALNYNDTEVTHFNPATLDELRIRQFEDSLPDVRGILAWDYQSGPWRTRVRTNYFGNYWIAHVGDMSLTFEPGSEVTVDTEIAYSLGMNRQYTVVVGAENLFNNYPDKNPYSSVIGAKYPESAPMTTVGGSYYMRLRWEF